jgi:hypothetical protein
VDGAPPCIAEVTALQSVPPSLGGTATVALQPIDTAPFQGKNYMGFPDMEGSAAPVAAPDAPAPQGEGSGLQLLDKSESAFGVKAPPAATKITPSTKPR